MLVHSAVEHRSENGSRITGLVCKGAVGKTGQVDEVCEMGERELVLVVSVR